VIFISFQDKLQFSAAFGTFHFAENSISIDLRVSGLICLKTLQDEKFAGIFSRRKWN